MNGTLGGLENEDVSSPFTVESRVKSSLICLIDVLWSENPFILSSSKKFHTILLAGGHVMCHLEVLDQILQDAL